MGRTISSIPTRNVTFEMRCSLLVGTDQAHAVKLIRLIHSISLFYQQFDSSNHGNQFGLYRRMVTLHDHPFGDAAGFGKCLSRSFGINLRR